PIYSSTKTLASEDEVYGFTENLGSARIESCKAAAVHAFGNLGAVGPLAVPGEHARHRPCSADNEDLLIVCVEQAHFPACKTCCHRYGREELETVPEVVAVGRERVTLE